MCHLMVNQMSLMSDESDMSVCLAPPPAAPPPDGCADGVAEPEQLAAARAVVPAATPTAALQGALFQGTAITSHPAGW